MSFDIGMVEYHAFWSVMIAIAITILLFLGQMNLLTEKH
jgi:hypothetical protein